MTGRHAMHAIQQRTHLKVPPMERRKPLAHNAGSDNRSSKQLAKLQPILDMDPAELQTQYAALKAELDRRVQR